MSSQIATDSPPSRVHSGDVAGNVSVTLLSIYVAVLWCVPSMQSIRMLGSLGAPSLLAGFICLGYWVWLRVARLGAPARRSQPVRVAYLVFFVVAWLSFAAAQARGLPGDEVSPAISGLLRTLSWAGVVLLANDGVTTAQQFMTLIRRIVLIGGLVAVLGLAQFFTGEAIIDRIHIPGLSVNAAESALAGRSGFARANATATHPLEFAVVLVAVFPLGVSLALTRARSGLLVWWAPIATGLACLLSSSRSAIVGFAIGLLFLLPVLEARARVWMGAAVAVGLGVVYVTVPGMLGSITGLFLNADASTTSRTNGLSVAAEIASQHLVLGRGFGTFLPKYYILDNQLAGLLIEVGIVGLSAFLALAGVSMTLAWRARKASHHPDVSLVAGALVASLAATVALFAFFDAFAFGMAAGTLALLIGLSGAVSNVVHGEARYTGRSSGLKGRVRTMPGAWLWSVTALLGFVAILGTWAALLHVPKLYWTRTEILIVADDISDEEAYVKTPSRDLLPLAEVVERVVNGGAQTRRMNTDGATLYGLGVRNGVSVHMLNTGNQWVPLFDRPIIVIETVAASEQAALAKSAAARQGLASAVSELQERFDVRKEGQAHAVAVLEEPTLVVVASSRMGQLTMMVASGVAVSLLVGGIIVLLWRLRSGVEGLPPGRMSERSSTIPELSHSPSS